VVRASLAIPMILSRFLDHFKNSLVRVGADRLHMLCLGIASFAAACSAAAHLPQCLRLS